MVLSVVTVGFAMLPEAQVTHSSVTILSLQQQQQQQQQQQSGTLCQKLCTKASLCSSISMTVKADWLAHHHPSSMLSTLHYMLCMANVWMAVKFIVWSVGVHGIEVPGVRIQ
jgi:hypothetical protein